ncbi:MAG: hypothetical protein CR975_05780, partial [Gammaproteobacteria bacterium]
HKMTLYQQVNDYAPYSHFRTLNLGNHSPVQMAMSDNKIVVAGNHAAYVYSTTDNWATATHVRLSPTEKTSKFGLRVAIDGENIAVSANGDQVFIFQPYDNGKVKTWPQRYQIKTKKMSEYHLPLSLGSSLVFNNNRLFVGAIGDGYNANGVYNPASSQTGSVYLFDFEAGNEIEEPITEPIPVNTSGSWYDPTFNGAGFNFIQTDQGFVAAFYGYQVDKFGVPLWLISDILPQTLRLGETVKIALFSGYEGNGGNFFHKPKDDNGLRAWGTLSLKMTTCDNGVAVLKGKNSTKTLRLQKLASIAGIDCEQTIVDSSSALSGSWYDPKYNGSGFILTEIPQGLIASFYGYQRLTTIFKPCEDFCLPLIPTVETVVADGQVNWLISDIVREQPIVKGQTYTTTLYAPDSANGASFMVAPSKNSGVRVWGTLALTFTSCHTASAIITEHFTDPETKIVSKYQVSHQLQRLAMPAGLTCID